MEVVNWSYVSMMNLLKKKNEFTKELFLDVHTDETLRSVFGT